MSTFRDKVIKVWADILPHLPTIAGVLLVVAVVLPLGVFAAWQYQQKPLRDQVDQTQQENNDLSARLASVSAQLAITQQTLEDLRNQDQIKRNDTLEAQIKTIEIDYKQIISLYEKILDLKGNGAKTAKVESEFSVALNELTKPNYASAGATLKTLQTDIAALQATLNTSPAGVPANVPASNSAPGNGYARQTVNSDVGDFVVDLIAGDLGSTRVQVETASGGDCTDNCPVDSLANYVAHSGGYAGINGPYFCPAEYPSCAGKKNSFDTLLMNKGKTYFNSGNNVYSTVPAVIFSGNSARFVGQSLEWGRDTGVDAVIAAQPMLVSGGNVSFGGDGDPKKGSTGNRSFIAAKGNTVYIGVVHGATVAEVGHILKALGMDSALNLDSGGSVALMVNGKYVDGPGRNTPFGIVLVRK